MQTFLPFRDFSKCAKVLDGKRLRNQRSEGVVVLKNVVEFDEPYIGWKKHPVVKMWRYHPNLLVTYLIEISKECLARGYNDDYIPTYKNFAYGTVDKSPLPFWINDERIYRSHRANLKRKNPLYYSWVKEEIMDGYFWPV